HRSKSGALTCAGVFFSTSIAFTYRDDFLSNTCYLLSWAEKPSRAIILTPLLEGKMDILDGFLEGHPGQGGVFPLNDAVLDNAQLALRLQAENSSHFFTTLANIERHAAETAAAIIFNPDK